MSVQNMDSIQVCEQDTINQLIIDPEFPFLVSFPRTGSHWLRMLMELYYETPSLVRIFYYKDARTFTCFHHHDLELQLERRKVIYLYRDPVHTVFSQLKYHMQDHNSIPLIQYWSDLYGKHLSKWLYEEAFTTRKVILRYEDLCSSIEMTFRRLAEFMGDELDTRRLQNAVSQVSKLEVQRKSRHDRQVVNLSETYQAERKDFSEHYSELIIRQVVGNNFSLNSLFNNHDLL